MSASDHSILEQASGWLQEGRKVAIATVVETWGSAPQPVGSQLVIDAEGNFIGSVSGGCVEGEVVSEAVDIIATPQQRGGVAHMGRLDVLPVQVARVALGREREPARQALP